MIEEKGNPFDIFRMMDMLHVPQVNDFFLPRLSQWNISEYKAIDNEFQQLKERFYSELFTEPLHLLHDRDPQNSENIRLYWYELLRYRENDWRTVDFKPVEDYGRRYRLLPPQLIVQLAAADVPLETVQQWPESQLGLQAPGQRMELVYVLLSATHMMVGLKVYCSILGEVGKVQAFPADEPQPGSLPEPQGDHPNVSVYELLRLSKVPQFSRLLSLNLQEAQLAFKKEIDAFMQVKQQLFDRCFQTLLDPDNGLCFYWFELTEFAAGDWSMTHYDGGGEVNHSQHEVLPAQLFTELAQVPVDTGRLHTDKKEHPLLSSRELDITWLKLSANYIVGTVSWKD